MKKKLIITAAILLGIIGNSASAQVVTSEGTDFWVAFLDNPDITQGNRSLSIVACPNRNCHVTISNPNTGWSQTNYITTNTVNQFYIPLAQAHTTNSGVVENKGIHVTSNDTITLYAITRGYPNQDYTNVLPLHMLRSDYMVQTFPQDRYSAEFAIVAAEDSVTVDFTMRGNSINGFRNGESYSVFLPRAGMMYQVESTLPGDLSGTRISARDGKRIAVFNGDACAYIPDYNTGNSCDHVVEQAMPTDYWGTKFVAIGANRQKKDYIRITALNNNCVIKINNAVRSTINAGNTYQYQMTTSTSNDYIENSQPAMTHLYFSSLDGQGDGDPSMTTIPPIEQGIERIRFSAVSGGNINTHYLCIVCPEEAIGSIQLDNTAISSSDFRNLSSFPGYKYAYKEILQGSHFIEDPSRNGFVVYLYGFGIRESYGYTIGTSARLLRRPTVTIDGNDIHLYINGIDICPGRDLLFETVLETGELVEVRWDFGDGSPIDTLNPVNYSYHDVGEYQACAYVSYINDSISREILHDTLCTIIRVHPEYFYDYYDTVAESDLPFNHGGIAYTTDVLGDTIRRSTRYGCDSIEVFHLKVWRNDTTVFDTVICDTLLPYTWHGIEFISDSIDIQHLTNSHGDDSIVITSLYTIPCSIPGPEPSEIDTNTIWIPNIFTPERNDNKLFQIIGHNLAKAEVVIFHRWGMFVTRFDGLTESWDGTKKGKPCPSGTYVYKVTYSTKDEPNVVKTAVGTVTLLR